MSLCSPGSAPLPPISLRVVHNHQSQTASVDSPLPFRGRHVSGDALFSAALGTPRTPPPRDTAPTPGLTQAAEAPASAPAAPQPPAASEGLNAQVATALSQVSAALSAQSIYHARDANQHTR